MQNEDQVIRWGLMIHARPGGGEWEIHMDEELFDSEEEAYDASRNAVSDFDKEVQDAFVSVVEIRGVV